MQVKIRMQRAGDPAQKNINWRIVAIPKCSPRDGRVLEILGYYDAAKKPAQYKLEVEKLEKWVKNGATMSDTVKSLYLKTKKAGK
ncbi:MAG: 30S ribosomal protein S16 [Candidatus Omnitrophica bacterium]|nr:30S ribosomal protein S16 [Candidatus Omnitrophota bacterium]